MKKILFATSNVNKVRELKQTLEELGFELITNQDLPEVPVINENGRTFIENATIKAHTLAEFTKLPVIADDSGLAVDYLNGQPGVRSARYASDHNDAANNAKLLAELGGIEPAKRTATFKTAIVASFPGKFADDLVVEGQSTGIILAVPRGDNGFGYDPLFYHEDLGKTFAEMTVEEKNSVSHRGNALRQLVEELPQWYAEVSHE